MKDHTSSELYQEIIANPSDRELRLVFADWLEEQGDPRGQLVRIQYELDGLSPGETGYATLKAKERKLLKSYSPFGSKPVWASRVEYRCGFIERIEITPTRLIKYAKEIFALAPIQEVRLKGVSKRFDKLFALPQLSQLRKLELRKSQISDDDLRALATSPNLQNLEDLELYSGEFHRPGAVLAQSRILSQLKRLDLSGGQVDDRAVEQICGGFEKLEKLSVSYGVTDRSLELIAASPGLRSLKELEISGGWYSDQTGTFTESGLRALGQSDFEVPLEGLAIRPTSPDMTHALSEARFKHLKRLDFSSSQIDDYGLQQIIRHLRNLVELRLSHCDISDDGVRSLAQDPLMSTLKKVYLTGNRISIDGINAILDSKHFSKKTAFHLNNDHLRQGDIDEIRKRAGRTFGSLSDVITPFHYR